MRRIRTVMSLLNTSSFGVISLAETGIKTPKDLEGKKLAITAGDALTQLFPAFAGFNKLDTSKITLVQIDPAGKVVALLEKRVDAILGGLDDQYFHRETEGVHTGRAVVREEWRQHRRPDHPDAGCNNCRQARIWCAVSSPRRRRSWAGGKGGSGCRDRGIAEGKAGPRLSTHRRTSLSPTCPTSSSPATEGKPIGWGALSDWEATEKLLKQYGNLETDKPASAFFTNDFLPK